jgi:hypothetical protein
MSVSHNLAFNQGTTPLVESFNQRSKPSHSATLTVAGSVYRCFSFQAAWTFLKEAQTAGSV